MLDAFSSDAIPVHLLTREAFAGYLSRLAPDGVIVMHISNRHMELGSVVAAVGAAEGLVTYLKQDDARRRADRLQVNAHRRGAGARPPISATCRRGRAGPEIKPDPRGAGLDRRLFRHSRRDLRKKFGPTERLLSASASSRSIASACTTDACRTFARPMSPKRFSRWISSAAREAAAKCTSPTGLPGEPPPGPAMPVMETARSAGACASAPLAIASAVSRLTAP